MSNQINFFNKIIDKLLNINIKIFEILIVKFYFSLIRREKYSKIINAYDENNLNISDVAIIIQGPLIKRNNFTIETILIYKKRFPSAGIIFSTWVEDIDKNLEKICKELNIVLISNQKPKNRGIQNINLQIKSTVEGLNYAKKNGFKYSIKTRSDQRIYKNDTLLYLKNLIKIFPLKEIKKDFPLKGRLVTVSLNTFKFRLYCPTDMFMFGFTDDLFFYWNINYDNRDNQIMKDLKSSLDWSKVSVCEGFFCITFLKNIKYDFNWTVYNSWKMFAMYFIIIDKISIDLFWLKYNRWLEYNRYTNYISNTAQEFCFDDWINLYNDMSSYNIIYEKVLELDNISESANIYE